MSHESKSRFFFWFIYIAVPITLIIGLVYIAVQQNYRQSANDPQIQMAEDAASKIASGTPIDQIVPTQKVDIASSLAPYMIVYNSTGTPLLSSATLQGEILPMPQGVFSDWKNEHEKRFTWQPASGVRSAVVIVHFNSPNGAGYVLAGRSLREVEMREDMLSLYVHAAWGVSMFFLLGATVLWFLYTKKRK